MDKVSLSQEAKGNAQFQNSGQGVVSKAVTEMARKVYFKKEILPPPDYSKWLPENLETFVALTR
jgi:hypothetical protein